MIKKIIEYILLFQGKMCFMRSKITLSLAVIILLALAAVLVNVNNHLWKEKHGVVIHDVIAYYGYLPATFIYKDLSFSFVDENPEFFAGRISAQKTPDGGVYQKMTMGLAFLYLPFFLIGHLNATITGAPITGFSEPYMFWLLFSSLVYATMGLLVLRKIMLKFFSDKLTAIVLLAIVAGTNLFYYITLEAAMSHAYNFFLFNLFIWLTIKWYEKPSNTTSICLGLVFGLIGLIRPTNGLILIFFVLYNISTFNHLSSRLRLYLNQWKMISIMIVMALLIVIPQFIFWKINTGSWLFYTYGDEGFFFGNPQIIRGLMSYRKGWLLYTPLMIFSLAGIFTLRKRLPSFFLPTLVFMLANIYVIFSWWDWTYGGSFGSRPMIDSYGLMALSLAAITDSTTRLKEKAVQFMKAVIVVMIFFNIVQMLKYKYNSIHYAFMTKEAYWHSFARLSGDAEFYDLLKPMDYSKLKLGIYAEKSLIRRTIGPVALNNFEKKIDDQSYISLDSLYLFQVQNAQENKKSKNGNNSALLCNNNSTTSKIEFSVKGVEKYKASVWIKPAKDNIARIIFESIESKNMYTFSEKIDTVDSNGWGRISLEVLLSEKKFQKHCLYIMTTTADSVFVDDLKIERLL
ncbi:MAG: hypothetical protein CVT92_05900 [Bacteroidetes bacterium HGW-Bacteroidetes-1]|jgi:hypothetical protein|nr:MAG: hypothetical protein CVT92_05900 [Bacteroidetes bacterium HGW-Bacteroidetes-1]